MDTKKQLHPLAPGQLRVNFLAINAFLFLIPVQERQPNQKKFSTPSFPSGSAYSRFFLPLSVSLSFQRPQFFRIFFSFRASTAFTSLFDLIARKTFNLVGYSNVQEH